MDIRTPAIRNIAITPEILKLIAEIDQELSRDVSHSPAIQQEPGTHKMEPQTTHTNQISQGFGLGL